MRYKIAQFVTQLAMSVGLKSADKNGFFTPTNTAEELALMAAGGIPEFPVVWVMNTANQITGFLHPVTGALISFPNAGYNPAAVAISGGASTARQSVRPCPLLVRLRRCLQLGKSHSNSLGLFVC